MSWAEKCLFLQESKLLKFIFFFFFKAFWTALIGFLCVQNKRVQSVTGCWNYTRGLLEIKAGCPHFLAESRSWLSCVFQKSRLPPILLWCVGCAWSVGSSPIQDDWRTKVQHAEKTDHQNLCSTQSTSPKSKKSHKKIFCKKRKQQQTFIILFWFGFILF